MQKGDEKTGGFVSWAAAVPFALAAALLL